jgi:hypothetical protein
MGDQQAPLSDPALLAAQVSQPASSSAPVEPTNLVCNEPGCKDEGKEFERPCDYKYEDLLSLPSNEVW